MPKQTENFPWGSIANFIMRSGGLRLGGYYVSVALWPSLRKSKALWFRILCCRHVSLCSPAGI